MRQAISVLCAAIWLAAIPVANACSPTGIRPTSGQAISGIFALRVNPGCTLGNGRFIRFYFDQNGHNVTYAQFPHGATTDNFNTTTLPNGNYQSGIIVWDATGLIIEGRGTGPSFTVSNRGIQPTGVPPPSGQSWHVTFDDEFNQDSAIDTSKWNGGAGAVPWCGNGQNIEGNQPCRQDYSRTYLINGVGLAIQPVVNLSLPFGGITAGLQSYGKFSQHYGFFEFSAKMPHDYAGEGDGLHPTLWFLPTNKTGFNIGCHVCGDQDNYGPPEIDLNQIDIGQGNRNTTDGGVHDYCTCEVSWFPQPRVSVGDLSASFHTYGLYWRNDGSGPNGSVQSYVDGVAQYRHVLDSNQPFWNNPIYPLIWMDPCVSSPFYGGATCTANTSNNDPFVIRHFRAWQAH